MKTSTLKQLSVSVIVGIVFAGALNIGRITNEGLVASLGQFAYFFILFAGTFFITGHITNQRGRDTVNMRIFAKKLKNEGALKIDDRAEMNPLDGKRVKGWLYLTDKFIIFANTNDPELIEKKAIKIPLSKVTKVVRFNPTAVTKDGIRISQKKGYDYEFLVGKTETWMKAIAEETNRRQHKKVL